MSMLLWIATALVCFLLIIAITIVIKMKPSSESTKKRKGDDDETKDEDKTTPPEKKDDHGDSRGSSGGHGPSLLDRIISWGIIALMAFLAYWLYQHLASLEGKPLVKHPVTVMQAGSGGIPVELTSTPQYHGCSLEAPEGSNVYQGSESYSDPIDIPKGQTICDDSFKSGAQVHYVFHHPGDDADQFDNNGQRRTDRVKFTTDQDVHVWLEDV
jgi:hypothetical protein